MYIYLYLIHFDPSQLAIPMITSQSCFCVPGDFTANWSANDHASSQVVALHEAGTSAESPPGPIMSQND